MSIKNIAVGTVIFFVGVGFGGVGKTPATTKEVVKEVPVEKIVEVEKNISEWRQLKTIDDKGFVVASDQMTLCSQGFKAVVNMDVAEMNRVATEVKAKTLILDSLASERTSVLSKLGY